jgi:transposase
MAKVYEKEFKVMIVELLNSGRKLKEVSAEYSLNDRMLRRCKREYLVKSGDFTKKRELTQE